MGLDKKKVLRATIKLLIAVFLIIVAAVGATMVPYYYKRLFTYPALEEERVSFQGLYMPPTGLTDIPAYQGVLHSHTYWSHDSRGTLEEILPAAKKAGLEFIFLSDHKRNQLDTFPRSIHGMYDGVLIVPGTESNNIMVNPLASIIIDWDKGLESTMRDVVTNGGLAAYVHTEEPHNWSDTSYQAMEIYNIHTDFLDEEGILPVVLNTLVNGDIYRRWIYREMYDDQTAILALWDSLNRYRRITGIAAVDAHNNQSFRARYVGDDQVEWVGPNAKTLSIEEENWLDALLLDDELKDGWAFKFEVDTYLVSFNFVNTHVFCDTLSARNIKEAVVAGRAFISFESLAPAKGFQFVATDASGNTIGIMGDDVPVDSAVYLKAVSPFPVRFRLMKDGKEILKEEEVYEMEHRIEGKGLYRLEAAIWLDEKWQSWVFTNTIRVEL